MGWRVRGVAAAAAGGGCEDWINIKELKDRHEDKEIGGWVIPIQTKGDWDKRGRIARKRNYSTDCESEEEW